MLFRQHVHTLAKSGSTGLTGDVTLTGGTNITLTQSGNDISIAAASGSMSIGGTVTSGTTGSVLFVGAGPILSQNNANLFWDNTNKRLGVGTAAPAATIEAMCTASTEIGLIVQGAASQSANLHEWQDSSANILTDIDSSGDINFLVTNRTLSASKTFVNWSGTTLTLNNSASNPTFIGLTGTISYTVGPAFALPPTFFAFMPTLKTLNANIGLGNPFGFRYGVTHTADNSVWTGADVGAAFSDTSIFSTANGGSFATYTHTTLKSGFTVNSGTITTRTAILISNGTGAGTLTNQIGIDIASLTKGGTTNIAIRTGVGGTIQFGNLITVYNNIATVSNGVPSELATVDLVTQAAAIGATTIYTPAATGLFRISIYLQVTRAATTSSILGGATGVVITYNDGDGNVAQSNTAALATTAGAIAVTAAGNTTATNLEGTMVIYARTGVAIQYAIGYTSVGVTTMQFAAHLKVEAL